MTNPPATATIRSCPEGDSGKLPPPKKCFVNAELLKRYSSLRGVRLGHNWTDDQIDQAYKGNGLLPGQWLGYEWVITRPIKGNR